MISKGFAKISIIVYYRLYRLLYIVCGVLETTYGRIYDVKMTRTTLGLLLTHLLKRGWENESIKSKIFWKSSLKFTLDQDDSHCEILLG